MSSEIVERFRGVSAEPYEGYQQAVSRVYGHLPEFQLYRDLSEVASHIEALEAENERLSDKIDGLRSDLDNAIETAYHRGAVDWVRMNYPDHFASWSKAKE